MSVRKWRWTEACEGQPCCGDCDQCDVETEDAADEAIVLMAGTVFGVIKSIEHKVKEFERFRKMLEEANIDGALDLKIAKATGSIEALHEFKKDLEVMQEGLEKLVGYDFKGEIHSKPC